MTSSTFWRLTEKLPASEGLTPAVPSAISYLTNSVSAAVWKMFVGPGGGGVPGLGNTSHGSIK